MTYCYEELEEFTFDEFIDWIIDEDDDVYFSADKHESLWNLFKEQLKIIDSYEVFFLSFIQNQFLD